MSSTNQSRALLPRLRSRAGTLTIGACAAALLAGGGVAQATGGNGDLFASGHATELSQHAKVQADLQQRSVTEDAKQAVAAKAESEQAVAEKAAADKAAAEKKAAADKAAAEKKANGWVTPISGGYTISATFGNDGNRWAAGHSGQDFAVPTGTAVKSVHKGTVVKAGGNGAGDGPAYGNAVVIRHADGHYSQYAHLSTVQVSVGDEVKAGDQIALSGNTGNSSGPHLHFEIRTTPDFGSAVDPANFLRDKGVDV
ncbi:M23 family metallopeptidase [Streptomyces sp. SM12]|uniref:M23 family metallopeptidase n=1 Tax=Streptomyces TaxID=1883 RepID=UPI000CD5BF85